MGIRLRRSICLGISLGLRGYVLFRAISVQGGTDGIEGVVEEYAAEGG
jgi:hypothetical protein